MLTAGSASRQVGSAIVFCALVLGCGGAGEIVVPVEPRSVELVQRPRAAERPVPALVEDFAFGSGDVIATAFGPGDLVAVANRALVRVWDTRARVALGALPLEAEADFALVAFTEDGRLVMAVRARMTVVHLHDTARAQVVEVDDPRWMVGTADGVVVAFRDERVVRYEGDPLSERSVWQLPVTAREDVSSIVVEGDRVFVTLDDGLFVLEHGAPPRALALPDGIGPVRASLGSDSLVVTSRDRMIALSLDSLSVARESPAEAAASWIFRLDCVPSLRACYRRRDLTTTELWRDDASERLASHAGADIVDRRTGRVARWAFPLSVLSIHEELGADGAPMGQPLEIARAPTWRPDQQVAMWLPEGHLLGLSDLTMTPAPGLSVDGMFTRDGHEIRPRAEDASVVIAGPEGERVLEIPGCDRRLLAREARNDREVRRRETMERQCADLTPFPFAIAPRSPLVAMAAPLGGVGILDYSRGVFTAWHPNPPGEVNAMAWSPDEAELSVLAGDALFTIQSGRYEPAGLAPGIRAMARSDDGTIGLLRRGALHLHGSTEHTIAIGFDGHSLFAGPNAQWVVVGARRAVLVRDGAVVVEHPLGPGRARAGDVRWTGPQAILITSNERPGMTLTRLIDGRTLELAIVRLDSGPSVIARVGERFAGPVQVRELVHVRASAADLLSARSSAEAAFDPRLVESFLSE
jgi:hypothetical protein